MFRLEDGRECLYQWDSERRLIISDKTISHVHYCNKTDDCSLVVETYEENGLLMADIPNLLLQTDWPIRVYGYCGGRFTKQHIVLKVIKRSRPADYIYTETEILRWHTVEEEMREAMATLDEKLNGDMDALKEENKALYSNVLKGKVVDTAALIQDVSPLSHMMEITTEPAAEVVIWESKNLFDISSIRGTTKKQSGGTLTCSEDGYISGSGTPTAGCGWSFNIGKLPLKTMTFSTHGTSSNMAAVIYFRDADGKNLGYVGVDSDRAKITASPQNYANYAYSTVEIKRSGPNYEMSGGFYLQLEIGSTVSSYEPAVSPTTYTANSEGVIEGIESIYPGFTFSSDSEVSINYRRDINAAIQQLTQAIISLGGNV